MIQYYGVCDEFGWSLIKGKELFAKWIRVKRKGIIGKRIMEKGYAKQPTDDEIANIIIVWDINSYDNNGDWIDYKNRKFNEPSI